MSADTAAANASKTKWERRRSASEVAAFIGGLLVVVGLVVEAWVNTDMWPVSGATVVIMGVTIETLMNGAIIFTSRKIDAMNNLELETLRNKTAGLYAALEEERLKQVPRRLRAEQYSAIVKKLKWSRPDFTVPVFVCRNDSEMMHFADDLIRALEIGADWRVVKGGLKQYDVLVVGVRIECGDAVSRLDRERAQLVVDVLREEGIEVSGPHSPRTPYAPLPEYAQMVLDSPLQILIGEKP